MKKFAQLQFELAYQIEFANCAKELPPLSLADQAIVATLEREGSWMTSLAQLDLDLTSEMLAAAAQQLALMRTLQPDRHRPGSDTAATASVFPHIFTVTDLPAFRNWATQTRLHHLVRNYIKVPVQFQGVHLRRDFPNYQAFNTELWHQDLEDRRILKLIIYLSDVQEEDGPYEYIPKSAISPLTARRIHSRIKQARNLGIQDDALAQVVPRSAWRSCPGAAGTVILTDTKAVFHHGRTRQRERAALFFVYTAARPLRPQHCLQYHDQTYSRAAALVTQ